MGNNMWGSIPLQFSIGHTAMLIERMKGKFRNLYLSYCYKRFIIVECVNFFQPYIKSTSIAKKTN